MKDAVGLSIPDGAQHDRLGFQASGHATLCKVMNRKITLYSTDFCGFCTRAKALLEARGLPYEEINLGRDPDGRAALVKRTGMMTFPQVVIGDEVVGGFMELVAAERSGKLGELLANAA